MKQNIMEFIRYVIGGLLTTCINIATYTLLVYLGLYYVFANVIATIIAIICAFFISKYIIFKQNSPITFKELFKFASARAGTMAFEILGLIACVEFLAMADIASKILITAIVIVLNYILSKKVVFVNN